MKKPKDANKVEWYVDYRDEDGSNTYGPDTYDECNKWIRAQYARTSSGEEFDVEKGPYKIKDSKITDNQVQYAVERVIDADVVMNLYQNGRVTITVPEGIDAEEFAKECISFINEIWSEPEVNFEYPEVSLDYSINEGSVDIFID